MPKIVKKILDQIVMHAQSESPNECCGLLAGTADVITEIYQISNLPSDDPRVEDLHIPGDRTLRYLMDPKEQFLAQRKMQDDHLTFMGIYHSHTHSPAYPSATDVRLAFYPDLLYLIVSLEETMPHVAAFSIVDQEIKEEEMIVERSH